MESEKYSWKWVTKDTLLSTGPCELVSYHLVPDAAGTATATIYDGQNTHGEIVMRCRTAVSRHCDFDPCIPIYCHDGLYIDIITNTRGILVQWRNDSRKEEG